MGWGGLLGKQATQTVGDGMGWPAFPAGHPAVGDGMGWPAGKAGHPIYMNKIPFRLKSKYILDFSPKIATFLDLCLTLLHMSLNLSNLDAQGFGV